MRLWYKLICSVESENLLLLSILCMKRNEFYISIWFASPRFVSFRFYLSLRLRFFSFSFVSWLSAVCGYSNCTHSVHSGWKQSRSEALLLFCCFCCSGFEDNWCGAKFAVFPSKEKEDYRWTVLFVMKVDRSVLSPPSSLSSESLPIRSARRLVGFLRSKNKPTRQKLKQMNVK